MKSLSNIFLRIALLIAVIISLILSWMIWSNNAKYQQGTQSNHDVQPLSQRSTSVPRNMDDVFAPTRLVLTRNHKQYLMYNNQSNTVDNVMSLLKQAKIDEISRISTNNKGRYQKFLHLNSSVQLSYPTKISINTFAEMVEQRNLQQRSDKLVNRIIILRNPNLSDKIYFLNDQDLSIYQARISGMNYHRLSKTLKNSNFPVDVSMQLNGHGVQIDYLQTLKIKRVSYLVSEQNNNTLISNLLNSQQGTNITTRKEAGVVTYRSGVNRSMIVDNKTAIVTFNDYTKKTPSNTMDLFSSAYQSLAQIGNSLTGVYLFNYNQREQTLSFRNYVDGFPIFQQDQIGTVNVNYTTDGQTTIFSKKFFQVPIPTDQKPVELPPTKQVLENLAEAGYNVKNFQNIIVGYSLSDDDQNKNIIDLTPTYFILVNNQWRQYSEMLNQGGKDGL